MNMMRTVLIGLLAAFALSSAAMAADVNVTGQWVMTVETPAGRGNPTFELKQDGDKVTGTYSGALGQAPVTGTVKGDELTLNIQIDAAGQQMVVVYSGKIEGNAVSGKVVLGDLGEGTFTGKKS
jgi:opacity protein-like surface antigen